MKEETINYEDLEVGQEYRIEFDNLTMGNHTTLKGKVVTSHIVSIKGIRDFLEFKYYERNGIKKEGTCPIEWFKETSNCRHRNLKIIKILD